ncbi:hypothetical protein AAMO2058_000788400 [Amorphochlora amoebiformis]
MAVENIDAKSLGELLRFVGDDEARMEMLNSEMAIEVPANLLVETKGSSEAQKSFAGLYTPLVYLFRVVASQGIRRRHREIYNLTKLLLEARADPQVLTSTTIFTPINRHQAAGKHTTHTALHLLMSPDDTCVVSFNLDGSGRATAGCQAAARSWGAGTSIAKIVKNEIKGGFSSEEIVSFRSLLFYFGNLRTD